MGFQEGKRGTARDINDGVRNMANTAVFGGEGAEDDMLMQIDKEEEKLQTVKSTVVPPSKKTGNQSAR